MSEPTTSDEPEEYGPYDQENPPPLLFHDWAELSAATTDRDLDEAADLLDARQISVPMFEACSLFWFTVLTDQLAAGNERMAAIYADACVRQRSARGVDARAHGGATDVDDLGERAHDAAFEPVDETLFGVQAIVDVLPFKGDAQGIPPGLLDLTRGHDQTGETVEVSTIGARPIHATPFLTAARAAAELRNRFTMAHYASLCAELETSPQLAAAILARYQLPDDRARAAVDAAWADHFATHPGDRARFDELVATYNSWLDEKGGS